MALADMDPTCPIFVEAESNKIGARMVPPSLWKAMIRAEHVQISAPLQARAAYLVDTYADLLQDAAALDDKLGVLAQFHGHEQVTEWRKMADEGAFTTLATALVQRHYDPGYQRSSRRAGPALLEVSLKTLDTPAFQDAAHQIAKLSSKQAGPAPR